MASSSAWLIVSASWEGSKPRTFCPHSDGGSPDFEQLDGDPRLIAVLLYGSGLRLMEACTLRVKDNDLQRRELTIRDGKGHKGRRRVIANQTLARLRVQLAHVRALHVNDVATGAGYVALPHALSAKYPNAAREWPWQWIFPATCS